MYEDDEVKARVGFARQHARKAFDECSHLFPEGYPADVVKALTVVLPGFEIMTLTGLPRDVSAVVHVGDKLIGVNADDPPVRQRFSASHEIGHIRMGHPDNVFDPESAEDKALEREADMFAGEFLVPVAALKKAFRECRDPAELARKFNVSRPCMFIRLKDSRLLNEIM